MERSFANARDAALRRLEADRATGRADGAAREAVDALNARPGWYTTSSCSGRVQLLALARAGNKRGARVLGRWHHPPVAGELARAFARAPGDRATWLLLQPPILHVVAQDLQSARTLLGHGTAAGFKGSHLRSVGRAGRWTIELACTGRIETPVAIDGVRAPEPFLALLAGEAPALLAEGHARLRRLAVSLSDLRPVPAVQEVAENG